MRVSGAMFLVAMLWATAAAATGVAPCTDEAGLPATVVGWTHRFAEVTGYRLGHGPTYRSAAEGAGSRQETSCFLARSVRRKELASMLEAFAGSPVAWLLPPRRPLQGSTLGKHFLFPELRDARDRGLISFPGDQPHPDALVDRFQLAEALAGILRHLGATEVTEVVLEDVSPGDARLENARLVVGHRLLPESRDHFHGEELVSRVQVLATLGRLVARAEEAQRDLDPQAVAGRTRPAERLLAGLRARRYPFGLVVTFSQAVEVPRWSDPERDRLAAPAPGKSLAEDLTRTVNKYASLERVPASSVAWLARQHGRTPETIRAELRTRFSNDATGGSWLGLTPRRDPPVRPLAVETLPPKGAGFPRARRLLDGAVMVRVPGGPVEIDGQTVTLSPYWIDEHEVSVARYARFLEATGHAPPPTGSFPESFRAPEPPPPEGLTWSAQLEHPELPVVMVSWEDARAYATWVGARLPTDAQWMLAARGSKARRYPWGNDWWGWKPEHLASIREQLQRMAAGASWHGDRDQAKARLRNPEKDDGELTAPFRLAHFDAPWQPDADTSMNSDPMAIRPHDLTPVGSHPEGASPFGLTEVAGNAREWCADGFDPAYQRAMPARDPEAPDAGQGRVVRGGSFLFTPRSDLATRRRLASGSRSHDLGFRLAAPATP